jgi:purine-binding chemotaxis protein CheW
MTIDKPSSTQTHFLHFRLCQREFCIPLKRVLRVISYVKLTAVPGMPSYFSGLLNLQGKQIPVLDLAKRLEIDHPEKYTINTPIVLCHDDEARSLGLIVDEVSQVESYDTASLELSSLLEHGDHAFVEAVMTTKRGDSLFLDIDKLIRLEDQLTELCIGNE